MRKQYQDVAVSGNSTPAAMVISSTLVTHYPPVRAEMGKKYRDVAYRDVAYRDGTVRTYAGAPG
jgi:hypothetical protein